MEPKYSEGHPKGAPQPKTLRGAKEGIGNAIKTGGIQKIAEDNARYTVYYKYIRYI
jgi:hypothetical protein